MDELLDIFICYAGPDRDVAVALKSELEALGHSAWVDHTDLVPGDRWADVIDEKLHAATMVAVLVSRAWGTHGTLYASEEVPRALERVRHEPVRVVPIKLDDIRGRELHYGLSQLVHIDASDRRMAPVAQRLSAALDDRAVQPEDIGGYLEPPASADPIDAAVTEAEASLRELRISGAPAPVIASTRANVLRLKRLDFTASSPRRVESFTSDGTSSSGWHAAIALCNTLSKREGFTPALHGEGDEIEIVPGADGYRLPTQAEWESAGMPETAAARPTRWGRSRRTHGACSTCTATYSSGATTGRVSTCRAAQAAS